MDEMTTDTTRDPIEGQQLPPDPSSFLRLLGAAQVPAPEGKVRVRLPQLAEALLNQLPAAHGGVLMTLLDSVMSRAASERPEAPSTTAITVEMSTRFHHPARGPLRAEGWVVRGGRSLCSCEGRIVDDEGHLVATGQGTFKYWLKPTRKSGSTPAAGAD